METPPIILLAFANSASDHLSMLKEEGAALKSALRPLEQRGFIRAEKEESTDLDELVKFLADYPDQLLIFHFGGHAGASLLELEGKKANAAGLAKLLGEQANLRLAFLNGCSTQKQVELLFDAGVKAVIATSVPINDERAKTFSMAFYQALANKRTIKRAFEFAKNALLTEFKEIPEMEVTRGLSLREDTAKEAEAMPWGLYVQPEHETEILNWHLPYYARQGLSENLARYIDDHFEVNYYIVMVLEEMGRYNPDIYAQMVDVRDGKEKRKDSSTFMDLVIENFPWVIGSQLRLLLIHEELDQNRMEAILSAYLVTTKILYFIFLANLWNEIAKRRPEEREKYLSDFGAQHRLTESNALDFDFLAGIQDLAALFEQVDGTFFAPEFERLCADLQDENSPIRHAHTFLEDLQHTYQGLSEAELRDQTVKAEDALAIILKGAAFLANYHMLTIRNIQIDNPPHQDEAYVLDLGRLNAVVNTSLRLYDDNDYRRKQSYTNCRSVVLVPNEDDFRIALNLSPFIIDKNTFLNNSSIDLFMYAFEKDDDYHYLALNHTVYQAMANAKGTDVIHTAMTDVDFQSGANIQKRSSRRASSFGSSTSGAEARETVAGKPIFALLENEFERFKTDFHIK